MAVLYDFRVKIWRKDTDRTCCENIGRNKSIWIILFSRWEEVSATKESIITNELNIKSTYFPTEPGPICCKLLNRNVHYFRCFLFCPPRTHVTNPTASDDAYHRMYQPNPKHLCRSLYYTKQITPRQRAIHNTASEPTMHSSSRYLTDLAWPGLVKFEFEFEWDRDDEREQQNRRALIHRHHHHHRSAVQGVHIQAERDREKKKSGENVSALPSSGVWKPENNSQTERTDVHGVCFGEMRSKHWTEEERLCDFGQRLEIFHFWRVDRWIWYCTYRVWCCLNLVWRSSYLVICSQVEICWCQVFRTKASLCGGGWECMARG